LGAEAIQRQESEGAVFFGVIITVFPFTAGQLGRFSVVAAFFLQLEPDGRFGNFHQAQPKIWVLCRH
jgi:hypothetical protein